MVSLPFFSPSPFLAWRRHSADPRTSRALHIHTRKSSEPSSSGSKKGGTKAQREWEKWIFLSFLLHFLPHRPAGDPAAAAEAAGLENCRSQNRGEKELCSLFSELRPHWYFVLFLPFFHCGATEEVDSVWPEDRKGESIAAQKYRGAGQSRAQERNPMWLFTKYWDLLQPKHSGI